MSKHCADGRGRALPARRPRGLQGERFGLERVDVLQRFARARSLAATAKQRAWVGRELPPRAYCTQRTMSLVPTLYELGEPSLKLTLSAKPLLATLGELDQ